MTDIAARVMLGLAALSLLAMPSEARFLQTDPIGYKDGPNWYAYVHDDPVNHVDPNGLQAVRHANAPGRRGAFE